MPSLKIMNYYLAAERSRTFSDSENPENPDRIPTNSGREFVRENVCRSGFVRKLRGRSVGKSRTTESELTLIKMNEILFLLQCLWYSNGNYCWKSIKRVPYRASPMLLRRASALIHKINSVRFPMLSKLAIEIYSCPATTAGIERVFSVAGHLLGPRATTMKDENFEKKLFCNINQEVMLSGRKRKYIDISWNKFGSVGFGRVRSGCRDFHSVRSGFGRKFF